MLTQQENQYNSSKEISLKELILKIRECFFYLNTKWIFFLLAGIIGAMFGFGYACFQKPIYTATLTFALEDEKSGGGGGLNGLASQFGFDIGGSAGGAFSGANLMELMKSRTLVEKTLLSPININGKETSLVEYYINFSELRKSWEKHPSLKEIHFLPNADRTYYTLQQDSILGVIYQTLIKQSLIVSQNDKKISIISIDVKSVNELFAKFFAERLAKEVSEFYVETKSKKSKINVAILEHQTDSIRAELNAAISGVATANDNTYNLNPALNIKRVPSVRRQVDVQANTAILTQLITNLELAKVTLRKETPLIQIIDKPILPLKKEKTSKFKSIVFGVFFANLFIISLLLGKRIWRNIMM